MPVIEDDRRSRGPSIVPPVESDEGRDDELLEGIEEDVGEGEATVPSPPPDPRHRRRQSIGGTEHGQ